LIVCCASRFFRYRLEDLAAAHACVDGGHKKGSVIMAIERDD